jgi:hypothetical protein
MGWFALAAQAGGAILNAQGAKQAANAQASQLNTQAAQDETSANQVQSSGYQSAKRIRQQGQSTVGQANAALAASGVDVSQGTANDVRTKITQNAESDALNTILNADSKATNLRTQAGFERSGAADALKAGRTGVLKSALSAFGGASQSYSGWKSAAGSSSAASSTSA